MASPQAAAPLEGVIKDEVLRMYHEVAANPRGEFHFYHGRAAADMFGYRAEFEWRHQPLIPQAPGDPGAVSRAEAEGPALLHRHRQRQAAFPKHRERPQALGQLNWWRSPGGRDVRSARTGRVQADPLDHR